MRRQFLVAMPVLATAACGPSTPQRMDARDYCAEHVTHPVCTGNPSAPVDPATPEILFVEDGGRGRHVLWLADVDHTQRLREKRTAYHARMSTLFGEEPDLAAPSWGVDESAEPNAPNSITMSLDDEPPFPGDTSGGGSTGGGCIPGLTSDGQGGCKMIFGADSRTIVNQARTSVPAKKFVAVTLDHHRNGWNEPCSGTFLDATHVLTAAHCVYDTIANEWMYAQPNSNAPNKNKPANQTTPHGVDKGKGYVCRSGWMDNGAEFEDQCDFIDARFMRTAYVSATSKTSAQARENDFAIVRLRTDNHPNGLGQGAFVPMSGINNASTLQQKTAVSHGYPAVHPPGLSFNAQSRRFLVAQSIPGGTSWTTWDVAGARQYKTFGAVRSQTTNEVLRTRLESSGGQSGAGIFYYTDDATSYSGQGHFLIGVLHGSNGTHTLGPTVRQFRDFAINVLP